MFDHSSLSKKQFILKVYGYILDTICSPEERTKILYQWKDDPLLLARNKFIGDQYNDFYYNRSTYNLVKTAVANYIFGKGIYFLFRIYVFLFVGRIGKMPGTVQEIRYINRDENTHLWLFRSMLLELKKEEPQIFTPEAIDSFREMIHKAWKRKSSGRSMLLETVYKDLAWEWWKII